MKHNIHADVWKTMAAEIPLYWKELSDKDALRAQKGEAELRKILKEHYGLSKEQVDEQLDAFISAYTLNTLEVRATPRI